ncbi:hypothetical protein D3C71_77920 [compost metagenome]
MENITRTVYGSYLQTCMLLGLPFVVFDHTTLNEKFSVQNGVLPDISETPRMRYYAIGNGGHRFIQGGNGLSKPEPIQHRATDAACFNHIPFVLREPTADLSVTERAKYGLRREETHNGTRYIAYYLKRMEFTGVVPKMEYKTVQDGETVTTPFVPNTSNLNPTPPVLNSQGVNLTTGDYTTTTAKVQLDMTRAEVDELLNVANILYADDGYAIISEVAASSGVDKIVQSPGPGSTTINFNDAIAVQVCSHMNTFFPLKFSNDGLVLLLDVGATEPLFSLE